MRRARDARADALSLYYISSVSSADLTPSCTQLGGGRPESAVEDFLDVGKDPNEADGQGRTALHYAAGTGNEEILGLLAAGGADLGVVDAKGNTALHYAAGYGRPGAARALLERGASPAVLNGNGKRPIEVARMNSDNPLLQDADLVAQMDAAGFVDQ